jgi:hypothetical protein
MLATELQAFAKQYPEHPLATEFIQAARMVPAWLPLASWANVRSGWTVLRVKDATTTAARLAQVGTYLKDHPAGPQGDGVAGYMDYLKAAVRAMPDGRLRNAVALEELLTHPLVADVFLLPLKDGRRFYLLRTTLAESKINDQLLAYRFDCIVDQKCATRSVSIRIGELEAKPAPAPQTVLSKTAIQAVRAFKGADWETLYLQLAAQAMSSTDIDPVLRAAIVKSLLDYGLDISPVRLADVEQAASLLQKQYVPVRWMDPDDAEAMKTRLQIAKILEGMSALKDAPAAVEKGLRDLEASIRPYRPVAVYLSTLDTIDSPESSNKADLFVATDRGDGQYALRKIGRVVDGKVTLDAKALSSVPRGSMLFAATD